MLLVNPASWPVPLGEDIAVTWLMLSEGAGFNDGTLVIHVNGPDGLAITRGYMDGSKFHNGQIVGPLETAQRAANGASIEDLLEAKHFEVARDPSGSTFTARFPTMDIPTKGPERPTQILLVLQLHVVASHAGVWDIDVSVRPASRTNFRHDLPRARLAAVEQTWLPVVSGLNPKASYETRDLAALQPRGLLMLNELQHKQAAIRPDRTLDHFAIASNAAVLRDEGQATLDACQSYLEAWLRPLAERQGSEDSRREADTEAPTSASHERLCPHQTFRVTRRGSSCSTQLATIRPFWSASFPRTPDTRSREPECSSGWNIIRTSGASITSSNWPTH